MRSILRAVVYSSTTATVITVTGWMAMAAVVGEWLHRRDLRKATVLPPLCQVSSEHEPVLVLSDPVVLPDLVALHDPVALPEPVACPCHIETTLNKLNAELETMSRSIDRLNESMNAQLETMNAQLETMNQSITHPSETTGDGTDDDGYLHVMCDTDNYSEHPPEAGAPRSILLGLTAADLPYDKHVIKVSADTNAKEAVQMLASSTSQCLLIEQHRQGKNPHHPVGVLDLTDATVWLLQNQLSGADRSVKKALRWCVTVSPRTSLMRVTQYLKQGWEYAAVEGGGLVSQGAILRYVYRTVTCPPTGFTLAHLRKGTREVCPTSATAITREVLWELVRCGGRSTVLVDEAGVAVGVISVSDVRFLTSADSDQVKHLLSLPCSEFVATSRGPDGRPVGDVIGCTWDTTVWEALAILVNERVHTLFVLDLTRRPVGVITTHDMMRMLL